MGGVPDCDELVVVRFEGVRTGRSDGVRVSKNLL